MSESFWDFSVRTYKTDSVPDACLSLQNERGVDVNMLLFCCWYGQSRGELLTDSFQQLLDFSQQWSQQVVKPLRKVRTWMKHDGCADQNMPTEQCMQVREKVKGIELEAEKIQQDMLAALVVAMPEQQLDITEQLTSISKNIQCYFNAINVKADDFTNKHLLIIIKAVLTELPTDSIARVLNDR